MANNESCRFAPLQPSILFCHRQTQLSSNSNPSSNSTPTFIFWSEPRRVNSTPLPGLMALSDVIPPFRFNPAMQQDHALLHGYVSTLESIRCKLWPRKSVGRRRADCLGLYPIH